MTYFQATEIIRLIVEHEVESNYGMDNVVQQIVEDFSEGEIESLIHDEPEIKQYLLEHTDIDFDIDFSEGDTQSK